jgi:formate dehydrogenase maturation protein FdhE
MSGEDTATDGAVQAEIVGILDGYFRYTLELRIDEDIPACAEDIAALVARARATGAAEERERIAVQNTHRNEAGEILYCPACGASAPEGYTTEQLSM